MSIRRLESTDERSAFSCGLPALDSFLKRYALQNQKKYVSVTYVKIDARDGTIGAFATVAAGSLKVDLPSLPDYPKPILRLARIAVHRGGQSQGAGKDLLRHVFVLARRMADEIGCVGVCVDPKPGATSYYKQFGFVDLNVVDSPVPTMFLALSQIPVSGSASR